ncbi:helix-turn-helix transcriptional regulator [Amycolatopsis regifaucium]|uniref:Helix-turn-helix transcriptional regulator n=1 Tax=Amycolatopsis regifaucium TaxID=546365 RepID=A0A154MVV3_9PSEU|nr:helix-turn-helix transcriptional regulator [Amycolatopsis regifaucium]OKA04559.1 helix-turn-helix transcriptional regulator [Amycolatopsis regifaucium]
MPVLDGFRALLVGPHPGRRRNLAGRLKVMGAETVTEVNAPHSLPGSESYDLVLLHTRQAPREVADLVSGLRRQGRKRVIVIASGEDPAPATAAFAANAVGYLVDRFEPAPPAGRAILDESVRGLSERELEILSLVADGKSNREIGIELALSVNTVKGHLARISRKLHTGDRSRMVMLALRSGAIS